MHEQTKEGALNWQHVSLSEVGGEVAIIDHLEPIDLLLMSARVDEVAVTAAVGHELAEKA